MKDLFSVGNIVAFFKLLPVGAYLANFYKIAQEQLFEIKKIKKSEPLYLVGHPQWVIVEIPGFGEVEFSGAYFRIAPAGRLNETISRV